MSLHDPVVQDGVRANLAHIWPSAHHDASVRLAIIDAYLQLRDDGIEELEVRATARSAAHQLAGVLDPFGLPHASNLARHVEFLLADVPSSAELPEMRSLALELRSGLEAATP